jgi:hypothetical protein
MKTKTVTKTGWWTLSWNPTSDPEITELDECTLEHIVECIKQGYNNGEIIQEETIYVECNS